MMNKLNEFFSSKNFKRGTFSTLITVVFIVIVILFNIIVGLFFEKFPVKVDLTTNKRYELSKQTIDFLKKNETKVTINILDDKMNLTSSDNYLFQVYELLNKMKAVSNKVEIKYFNLLKNPSFAAKYSNFDLAEADIFIVSDLRQRKVSMPDLFNWQQDPTTGEQTVISSKAEEVLTGAIFNVVDKTPIAASFISGHGEAPLEKLQKNLDLNGYVVSQVDLTIEDIKKDTNTVFISAPQRDFSVDEITKLKSFLNNSGKFGKNLLYFAPDNVSDFPVLNAFLTEWGIKIDSGYCYETDETKMFKSPYSIFQNVLDKNVLKDLKSQDLPIISISNHPLEATFESKKGYVTEVLMSTSSSCVLIPIDAKDNFDIGIQPKQTFSTAIKSYYYLNESTKSTLTVFGSNTIAIDELLSTQAINNAQFLNSYCNSLSEKKSTINIAPKEILGKSMGFNNGMIGVYQLLFIILIPLAVLITGFIVWIKRRNR